jgi:hypothetical protein
MALPPEALRARLRPVASRAVSSVMAGMLVSQAGPWQVVPVAERRREAHCSALAVVGEGVGLGEGEEEGLPVALHGPAGQHEELEAAPRALVVPAGQGLGVMEPRGQKDPAGHCTGTPPPLAQ